MKSLEFGHTFHLRDPWEAYYRFVREMMRLDELEANEAHLSEQVDCAISATIAAWHMTDWVWTFGEGALKAAYSVEDRRSFQQEIKKACKQLQVCDIIANAAKHGGTANKHPDRPDLQTVISADDTSLQVRKGDGTAWSLSVKVDGKDEFLSDIFYQVSSFWRDFLEKHFPKGRP